MDICGSATSGRRGSFPSSPIARIFTSRRWSSILGSIALFAALTGCSLKAGTPPRTDQLKNLDLGVSAQPDVLRVLGEPKGRGMARLSVGTKPRSIWSYEYAEADGRKMNLKMLLVFFDEDKYDGHLWFSGSSLMDRKE